MTEFEKKVVEYLEVKKRYLRYPILDIALLILVVTACASTILTDILPLF